MEYIFVILLMVIIFATILGANQSRDAHRSDRSGSSPALNPMFYSGVGTGGDYRGPGSGTNDVTGTPSAGHSPTPGHGQDHSSCTDGHGWSGCDSGWSSSNSGGSGGDCGGGGGDGGGGCG